MIESGRMAIVMSYDMEEFLDSCVAQYCELAKITSPLRSYTTPILLDDQSRSAASAPGTVPVTECPWCHHTVASTPFVKYPSVTALVNKPKVRPVETGVETQQGLWSGFHGDCGTLQESQRSHDPRMAKEL